MSDNHVQIFTGRCAMDFPGAVVVAPGIYNNDFETIMAAPIHISESDIRDHSSSIGKMHIRTRLRFHVIMKDIQLQFDYNKRDTYVTVAAYGLSKLEHKYDKELKRVVGLRSRDLHSGNMMKEIDRRYSEASQFFNRTQDGIGKLTEYNFYGDKQQVIAPIQEYAEYLNIGSSDMLHIVIAHAILEWKELPEDYKGYFSGVIKRFDEYVSSYYTT